MYERLIFVTELERAATRETLSDNFPLGKLWYVPDADDFLMDAEFTCTQQVFFRYAIQTPGPAVWLIHSCLNLSLMMHNPPIWMVEEIRKLNLRLPA